jgi:hypothetical protein
MNIEPKEIVITCSEAEVFELVVTLKRDIEDTINNHWKNWMENKTEPEFIAYVIEHEGKQFTMFKQLAYCIGKAWMVDEVIDVIKKVYGTL